MDSTQTVLRPADREILFRLYGDEANKTHNALRQNKRIHWDGKVSEGREFIEVWVEANKGEGYV